MSSLQGNPEAPCRLDFLTFIEFARYKRANSRYYKISVLPNMSVIMPIQTGMLTLEYKLCNLHKLNFIH
jgi:hypothetical protein